MSGVRPIVVVAGARPNFMKVAPILAELERRAMPILFVHTGQHYDDRMSDAILRDLNVRTPDVHLGVGSGSHAQQTARVMEHFEPVVLAHRPRWVVVVGDVNSTLACSLVAAKLRYSHDCRLAHVEAGLRSNDWRMPEEVNRVVTDRLADLLLTPSLDAHPNLAAEGISSERVCFVGNVMIDTLFAELERARALSFAAQKGLPTSEYVLATLHRPSNVDQRETLQPILEGLGRVASRRPVLLPLHPRTRSRIEEFGLSSMLDSFTVCEPLGYLEMLSATDTADVVLTDSGGLQEETTALGVRCITLRESTERPVTIAEGTNTLIEWPPTPERMSELVEAAAGRRVPVGEKAPAGWDGKASHRIVDALVSHA